MYNATVLDHFQNPRNVGELPSPALFARAQNSTDGDIVDVWLRVEDDRIADAKFRCAGCTAAIACASVATEWVKGKSVAEASAVTRELIADLLGGLPPSKMICSNLAPDAIRKAMKPRMNANERK